MISNRQQFVTRRNRYYATMFEALRAAQTIKHIGTARESLRRYDAMQSDYPAICEISALQAPTASDFERAETIFSRHGV